MTISPYYIPMKDWRAATDLFLAVLDPRLAPFWVAAVLGGAVIGWKRDRRLTVICGLVIINASLYWLLIPYRTQQRFMFHSLGLAVVPVAVMIHRARWLQVGCAGLIAVHLFTGDGWPFSSPPNSPPWDLSPIVPNAYPGMLNLTTLGGLGILIVGFGSLVVAWLWNRARVTHRPLAAISASAAILMSSYLLNTFTQPASPPFPPFRDYYLGWLDLESRSGPTGLRIAYAGTNLPYFLMGRDFRNDVRYINIDAHRDWLLHDYHREAITQGKPNWPYPRPGWDRITPNYEAWLTNLKAAGTQVLVVAKANRSEGPHNIYDTEGFPIERAWAELHPDTFTPLYGIMPVDPLFKCYRVNGSGR